jgi:hypothetical protein
MDLISLGPDARKKSLERAGRDIGLSGTFAHPDNHSATIALLVRHLDELRMKLRFIETELAEARRPWWRRLIGRWRSR